MNSSKEFVDKCILVSSMEREELVKYILAERFNDMSDPSKCNDTTIPSGIDILSFVPCQSTYPAFAFSMCSMTYSREDIIRHVLEKYVEANSFKCPTCSEQAPTIPDRKRRRGMVRRSEAKLPPRIVSPPISPKDTKVVHTKVVPTKVVPTKVVPTKTKDVIVRPSVFSLFKKKDSSGDSIVMSGMTDILENYFPTTNCIYPGVYGNKEKSEFVLLSVDNGRYKASWKSCGSENILKWFTSHDDTNKSVMKSILHGSSTVHIVRKRNGEIRYMGRCKKIEEINIKEGHCSMYIS